MLIQMLYLQKRVKDLYLFLPEREDEFEALFQFQYTFREKLGFPLHILSNEVIGDHFPQVTAMQTDHLWGYEDIVQALRLPNRMRSWAFRIGVPGSDLVYTADIQSTDCIATLLEGCHTTIVDAMHPPLEQILKLANNGIPRVLLTHGLSEELELWLQDNQTTNFELALESIQYQIDL